MQHSWAIQKILILFFALLAFTSPLAACNAFSHQWSLTSLEEETGRLPRMAMEILFQRLPLHLASASKDIPWLQTASSALLLEVDAATHSWIFRNDPQTGAAGSFGIIAQSSGPQQENIALSLPRAGHGGITVLPRLEPPVPSSDIYALLQKRASETGTCVAAIEVISGYRSLSHFVDLLPIRLGTVRAQCFERIEVLVRIAGPHGDIGLIGPLKAEAMLSTDTRLHLGSAYVGRFEWRSDQEPAELTDLAALLPGMPSVNR